MTGDIDASVWLEHENRLRKELRQDELTRLLAIENLTKLRETLAFLKDQRQALCHEITWSRMSKVLDLLAPLARAADSLAQGICLPSNMLCGALGLILISSRAEIVDLVLCAYESLLSVLPRVDSFARALEESPNLKLAIADAYDAYTTLSIRSIKIFGRGPKLLTWSSLLWMRDRKLFQDSIHKLECFVRKARQEAGYILLEERKSNDSKALQEIVRNTETIMSSLASENDRLYQKSKTQQSHKFTVPPQMCHFVGRDERIEEMHKHLYLQDAGSKSGQQRSVVLCGLGGIGKTQLAIEYAHRFRGFYTCCFWVTCDSTTKVFEGFAEIARALELDEVDVVQNLGNVKDWFRRTENWLLIFDNAESPNQMSQFWPKSGNGAILVTTQDASWLSQEYITQSYRLGSLNESEGVDLVRGFFERNNHGISDIEAKGIVGETGGLPLAIRQISSYILAENMDTTRFLEGYRAHQSSKAVDAWEISATPWSCHTLATFLNFAFEKLTTRAISILGIMSLLDADKIQERLFRDEGQLDEGEATFFGDPLDFDNDISRLCRYSLISKSRNEEGIYFSAHRQVKRHVLDRLTPEQLQPGWTWTVRRLRRLFPRQSPFAGELNDGNTNCAACINHVLALRATMPIVRYLTSEPQDLASLFLDGGIYLWTKGSLVDGKALTGEAKAMCDGTRIEGSMIAQIYSFHASILSDSGNIEQGLEYFEKSLEVLKSHLTSVRDMAFESDYALLANAWNNLAGAHCALGQYGKAELYNELSLQRKLLLAEQGHPMSHLLCLSYHNMANTCAGQTRYDEAAIFFEKALKVATLEESISRRALTSHNFGIMRLMQNQVDEARGHFETAYQLRCEKFRDHPDTAASLHMLACCYHRKGDDDSLDISRYLLEESLRILRCRPSNADERRIARSLFKLSLVQEALGDESSAAASRLDAGHFYTKLTGKATLPASEDEFDALVAYM
ncbi:hypothetical protein F4677DRAFT_443506 [Hypoxylon crocopeplum]|nr:hypothetical protein F4677DRAFT_443506 [Hypoxylon crocopeplum]